MSPDEDNVVRYASGYVPMVSKKRHDKTASKSLFLSLNASEAWLLMEKRTHYWNTQLIGYQRLGGLFEVNDTAYLLF